MSKKGRIRRENAELKEQIAKLTASKEVQPSIPKTRKTGRKRLQMQKIPSAQDLMTMVKRLEHKNVDLLKENVDLRSQLVEWRAAYGQLQKRLPKADRTPLGIHLPKTI